MRKITTDSGSSMILVYQLLRIENVPCFSHKLNLIVMNILKRNEEANNIITKCKKIVNHFHKSGKFSNILRNVQQEMKVNEYKLIQQVDTRWNSVYYMAKRITELFDVLVVTLSKIDRPPAMLTNTELNFLFDLCDLLELFDKSTKMIFGEKYCTISMILPIINELYGQLLSKNIFKHKVGEEIQ